MQRLLPEWQQTIVLQLLVLALLGQLKQSHMLQLYSQIASWNLCESSYLPYILAHTICHKIHINL